MKLHYLVFYISGSNIGLKPILHHQHTSDVLTKKVGSGLELLDSSLTLSREDPSAGSVNDTLSTPAQGMN